MTAVDELAAFVRRQLAEDERVAREAAANNGVWSVSTFDFGTEVAVSRDELSPVITADGRLDRDDAEHIARWDPARVLAEVEAKRGILDECADTLGDYDDGSWLAKLAIQLLAQPYAGQPGWRAEWAGRS